MTPIERVQRRSEAAKRLNVSIYTPADVLKATWRRAAFEFHPDRNGGDSAIYDEMRTAYDILKGDAPDHVQMPGGAAGAVRPRRVVSRTTSRTLRPVY